MQHIGYYKYDIYPNQKLKIPFKVFNLSNRKIKVNNYINDGYDKNNGHIGYDKDNPSGVLNSKQNRISSMIIGENEKKMIISPHKSQSDYFIIKVPGKVANGSILGGIISTSDNGVNSTSNISVKNNIQYSTSIVLNNNANLSDVNKIFLAGFHYDHSNIKMLIHNDQNLIVHGYKISFNLYRYNKLVGSNINNSYSLAPNSIGEYNFNFMKNKPGHYKLLIKITDEKNNSKFFTKEFNLNHQNKDINFYSKYTFRFSLSLLIIIIFCISILGLFIIIIIYIFKIINI